MFVLPLFFLSATEDACHIIAAVLAEIWVITEHSKPVSPPEDKMGVRTSGLSTLLSVHGGFQIGILGCGCPQLKANKDGNDWKAAEYILIYF